MADWNAPDHPVISMIVTHRIVPQSLPEHISRSVKNGQIFPQQSFSQNQEFWMSNHLCLSVSMASFEETLFNILSFCFCMATANISECNYSLSIHTVRPVNMMFNIVELFFQLCPTGYFTCQSGSMTCIQNTFQCDCSSECDDGSDEDATYAGCTNTEECLLRGSAGKFVCWNTNVMLNITFPTFRIYESLLVPGEKNIIYLAPTI